MKKKKLKNPKRKLNNSKKIIYLVIKNYVDIIFSFIFLFLSLPLSMIIILLIKFSSRGPIFYFHERLGKNKKKFLCIKFRTMHPESEDMFAELISRNETLKKEFLENHKLKNDPRITNIGRFLRKTSLDEIPQFLNVLRGEMSIVGPRPIVDEETLKYGKKISEVLEVKPGITGLWQISGRNNLSYQRRVELDSLYVNQINFFLDLRIIIRTFGVIFFPKDRGSY